MTAPQLLAAAAMKRARRNEKERDVDDPLPLPRAIKERKMSARKQTNPLAVASTLNVALAFFHLVFSFAPAVGGEGAADVGALNTEIGHTYSA